jgi:hypothetical protein
MVADGDDTHASALKEMKGRWKRPISGTGWFGPPRATSPNFPKTDPFYAPLMGRLTVAVFADPQILAYRFGVEDVYAQRATRRGEVTR